MTSAARGQALDVVRVAAGMGEGVVQLGIGQASRMVRSSQGEKRGGTAGEVVQAHAHRHEPPTPGGAATGGYIFSPGSRLACSIQAMSRPWSTSSSSWMSTYRTPSCLDALGGTGSSDVVEPLAHRALPTGHGRDVGLHRLVPFALGDLRVPAGEQLRFGARILRGVAAARRHRSFVSRLRVAPYPVPRMVLMTAE